MEELNLGDLDFDTSSINLFDDETGIQDPKEKDTGKPNPDTTGGTPPASDDDGKGADDKTNTDGDDKLDKDGNPIPAGQESVADQSKEKNQVQAGKTADGKEGSDSSSPKLNETEQLYSNLAAEFKAKGVLPELEDITAIRSLDDLNAAIKKQVDSQLTDRQRQIEEAKNVGAPVTEVAQKVQTIDKLKAVTPEFIKDDKNVEFRRTAIAQDFIDKGYGEDRAKALAQRSIDAGTDIEDAEFAVNSIIKSEESSLQKIIDDAKQKEKDSLTDIKSYIATTPEVLPGIVLNDSQKDELYNQITTDLGNKENAFMRHQKADPVGSRIKLEAFFFLTKGLTDFSVFGQRTESKITNNIENLLRGANFTEEGKIDTNVPDDNSNFKLADLKDFEIE